MLGRASGYGCQTITAMGVMRSADPAGSANADVHININRNSYPGKGKYSGQDSKFLPNGHPGQTLFLPGFFCVFSVCLRAGRTLFSNE